MSIAISFSERRQKRLPIDGGRAEESSGFTEAGGEGNLPQRAAQVLWWID